MDSLEKIVASLVQTIQHRYYGKYRGLVVENEDPELLGRLKVMVPSVLGTEVVTGWAMPCVPYGGDVDQGMLFIPEVGAGVWIEFEEGDLEFPIWVGTFWSKPNDESELPKPNEVLDGAEQEAVQTPPTRKIIKTVKGHTLQFEDADEAESVLILEAVNKHLITMNLDGITLITGKSMHSITLKETDGEEMIMISDGANGHSVLLDADGITVIDGVNAHTVGLTADGIAVADGVNGHTVGLTADGIAVADGVNGHTVDLNGKGVAVKDGANGHDVKLDSSGITLKSGGDVTVSGANVSIDATSALSLSSSGDVTIEGSMIKLNP